jgi:hypothetical protein
MALESRGKRRSKILHLVDSIAQIDLVDRQYFKRTEITSQITHSYKHKRVNYTTDSHLATQQKKTLKPSLEAIELNFSSTNALKLGLFSESVIQEALYQCKKKGKTGFIPREPQSYIIGMAINIAKKKGEKPDWRSFYQQMRE